MIAPLVDQVISGTNSIAIFGGPGSLNISPYLLTSTQMVGLLTQAASKLLSFAESHSGAVTFSWYRIDCKDGEMISDVLQNASNAAQKQQETQSTHGRRGSISTVPEQSLVLREEGGGSQSGKGKRIGTGRGMYVPGLWEIEIKRGEDVEQIISHVQSRIPNTSHESGGAHSLFSLHLTYPPLPSNPAENLPPSFKSSSNSPTDGSASAQTRITGKLSFLLLGNLSPIAHPATKDISLSNIDGSLSFSNDYYPWVKHMAVISQWLSSGRASPPFSKCRLMLVLKDLLCGKLPGSLCLLLPHPKSLMRDSTGLNPSQSIFESLSLWSLWLELTDTLVRASIPAPPSVVASPFPLPLSNFLTQSKTSLPSSNLQPSSVSSFSSTHQHENSAQVKPRSSSSPRGSTQNTDSLSKVSGAGSSLPSSTRKGQSVERIEGRNDSYSLQNVPLASSTQSSHSPLRPTSSISPPLIPTKLPSSLTRSLSPHPSLSKKTFPQSDSSFPPPPPLSASSASISPRVSSPTPHQRTYWSTSSSSSSSSFSPSSPIPPPPSQPLPYSASSSSSYPSHNNLYESDEEFEENNNYPSSLPHRSSYPHSPIHSPRISPQNSSNISSTSSSFSPLPFPHHQRQQQQEEGENITSSSSTIALTHSLSLAHEQIQILNALVQEEKQKNSILTERFEECFKYKLDYEELIKQLKEDAPSLSKKDRERLKEMEKKNREQLWEGQVYKEVMEATLLRLQGELKDLHTENEELKKFKNAEEKERRRHKSSSDRYGRELNEVKKKLVELEKDKELREREFRQLLKDREVAIQSLGKMKADHTKKEQEKELEKRDLEEKYQNIQQKLASLQLSHDALIKQNALNKHTHSQEMSSLRQTHSFSMSALIKSQEENDQLRAKLAQFSGSEHTRGLSLTGMGKRSGGKIIPSSSSSSSSSTSSFPLDPSTSSSSSSSSSYQRQTSKSSLSSSVPSSSFSSSSSSNASSSFSAFGSPEPSLPPNPTPHPFQPVPLSFPSTSSSSSRSVPPHMDADNNDSFLLSDSKKHGSNSGVSFSRVEDDDDDDDGDDPPPPPPSSSPPSSSSSEQIDINH